MGSLGYLEGASARRGVGKQFVEKLVDRVRLHDTAGDVQYRLSAILGKGDLADRVDEARELPRDAGRLLRLARYVASHGVKREGESNNQPPRLASSCTKPRSEMNNVTA